MDSNEFSYKAYYRIREIKVKKEILNGLAALQDTIDAYESLKNDVLDINEYNNAAYELIDILLQSNEALCNNPCTICNGVPDKSDLFGTVEIRLSSNEELNNKIKKYIPSCGVHHLSVPVVLDYTSPICMCIETDKNESKASQLAQFILISMLRANSRLKFRCGDFVSNGRFFADIYRLIVQTQSMSGGTVYTEQVQLDELLKQFEKEAAFVMSTLDTKNMSVKSYNKISEKKIPESVNVLYLKNLEYGYAEIEKLVHIVENGAKNGMSFIIAGEKQVIRHFHKIVDFYLTFKSNKIYIGEQGNLLLLEKDIHISPESVQLIIEKLHKVNKVDTSISNLNEIGLTYQSMDSTEVLRIPFAYDQNHSLQFFEIGGEAPSHALISGSTGSGKSVALHTLIMQIVYNYHPDDVEIWAIDYKAVEFDSYINNRTPHFRVIAHDTSVEFSLSLLDLLEAEYEARKEKFLKMQVQNIEQYRDKCGKHAMPRIVVFIDEFQIMTQAVQSYTGDKDYRTTLENLLRFTRAMGISFILCSQTIASGLSGLTTSARDQIGGRLSLKHDDDNEIRETLTLWGNDHPEVIESAKRLRRGEGIYKRIRLEKELIPGKAVEKPFEFKHVHILYLNEALKQEMIEKTNAIIGSDYIEKEEIIVRGGGRIAIKEKERHPLMRFVKGDGLQFDEECIQWYPAAPTTLKDAYEIKLENSAGANMLLIGENDPLRDSIIFHTVCGFLMNPDNIIYANFLDTEYSDRRRTIEFLHAIHSEKLIINEDIHSVLNMIGQLKKIRPVRDGKRIYLWYGLEKLKNELFLLKQDENESEIVPEKTNSKEEMLTDLMSYLTELNGVEHSNVPIATANELPSYDDCVAIMRQAFEAGPENGHFHFVIFNNNKGLKKSNVIVLENFENRIGTKMSVDDSFELFGSSLAVDQADENTVIFYPGSGKVTPLRPYLMPEKEWVDAFNHAIALPSDEV